MPRPAAPTTPSENASSASTAGYSGKPLSQKLGLKAGQRVRLVRAPADYWTLCGFDAGELTLIARNNQAFDFGHIFATERVELERELPALTAALDRGGMLWVSWPKKASKVPTDIGEDTLRELILPLGLVDVKVCAVTAVWSGLKFLRRRE
ncbi:MAG: DUF3052 domain-containing protein [Rudaea sp.]|uniref:DUF3052 domain-containing protein n=1 Tax=unclassified Rudaea TaxID=2627037 RepID=UPI0010F7494D|nr:MULTISPECIES: DUF3052 domain-containing protein [unclassified Rudaea]MBN8886664.1 DUF3052 domain-containing protein [Rudaea sp.]MBR0346832.1 DUF3052 domain-containing protein [Rudaea sp.]